MFTAISDKPLDRRAMYRVHRTDQAWAGMREWFDNSSVENLLHIRDLINFVTEDEDIHLSMHRAHHVRQCLDCASAYDLSVIFTLAGTALGLVAMQCVEEARDGQQENAQSI